MTTARTIAKERQLDWLLGEALGGISAPHARNPHRARAERHPSWLAAAVFLLAGAAALGVAILREPPGGHSTAAPQGELEWREVYNQQELEALPRTEKNLRCFDFDDAAVAALAQFPGLERLDLSGMAVSDQGNSVSLRITDAGLANLTKLTKLRWLCLKSCGQVHGSGLAALENLPLLEHLDLTYTQVTSAAVERLQRLPSLRELSLSACTKFHGRSLATLANLPGLRRLELRGCTTLSAADIAPLAQLRELTHLDLSNCQGRYRGQTLTLGGEEAQDLPTEDGVGITDASIEALADLKLETLLLGGSESLTDGFGDTLAKMVTLRTLDLSSLPKITGALLAKLPNGLTSLALDHNERFHGRDLRKLPALPHLTTLGLTGLSALTDDDLRDLLDGRSLTTLRLGGEVATRGKGGMNVPTDPRITSGVADLFAAQKQLEHLSLGGHAPWIDKGVIEQLATLPVLAELDFSQNFGLAADVLAPLAGSQSLRSLRLVQCIRLREDTLPLLAGLKLRELDLYLTKLPPDAIRAVAKNWPGCLITMPNGQRLRVPETK
jgi:hypothetical protein